MKMAYNRNRQPSMEDENAGRSMRCVFVLVPNATRFPLGRTNHRVSYLPGKANRYPPRKKDHIYNRRVGILPLKVKNKRVVCMVEVLYATGIH